MATLLLCLAAPSLRAAADYQSLAQCRELATNGDFEVSGLGWSFFPGAALPRYATENTFAGSERSIFLGAAEPPSGPSISAVEQLITLPAESASITLSYAYYPTGAGTPSAADRQAIQIIDPESGRVLDSALSSQLALDQWLTAQLDLSRWAGNTVLLRLSVNNDGEGGYLGMYVDGISALACPPAAADSSRPLLSPFQPAAPATGAAVSPAATLPIPTPYWVGAAAGEMCDCTQPLYTCDSFVSWSAAQACFTHCRVTVGFDIHNLDADGDGLACELDIRGNQVPPATSIPRPGATPSPTLPSATPTWAMPPLPTLVVAEPAAVAAAEPLSGSLDGSAAADGTDATIGDLALAGEGEPTASPLRRFMPFILAGLLILLVIGAAIFALRRVSTDASN